MSFNAEQIAYAGRHAIDYFLKNDPVDQVNVERPLIKRLMSSKKDYAGGLQHVVEQLRISNDSNFQSYFGDQQVTYNRKRTLEQAKYKWGSFHDGFGLNEDELAQNGISMTDDRNAVPSDAEKVQLTNLLSENMETLKIGFQENLDLMLHRDGTQSGTDIPGLDHLVQLSPATGVVGGLDANVQPLWRNYAKTGIEISDPGDLVDEMEIAWRECIRRGGSTPNFILVGSDFVDAYRKDATAVVTRELNLGGAGGNRQAATVDASIGAGTATGLFFKGVELIWDPVFDELDDQDSPAVDWAKRCYFLNMRFITLRPIKGHWLVPRKPPRVYDRYVHYWAITAKAALTTSKRNAHAVLALD
jgi:hypothetical protein